MTMIKWRDSYNTGVEQFDQEHHIIVDLIDVLYRAVRNNNDNEVEKAVNELISYTESHFEREEQMMADANFPHLEEHKKQHVLLKRKAKKFQQSMQGKISYRQVYDFYHFLREWLIGHIVGEDKKYGAFLAARPAGW